MDGLEDMLYRVGKLLISPREALYVHIVEGHSLSLPLLIYITLSFSLTSLPIKASWLLLGPPATSMIILDLLPEISGVIGVAFSISWLILYVTMIHVTARILGYTRGRWEETLCAVAYSILPQSLTAFLMGLSYIFISYELLLTSLAFLCLASIWSAYVIVEGISLIYEASTLKSLLISLLIPLCMIASSLALLSLLGLPGLVLMLVSLTTLYYWREVG
ncbi:MAG: hypothetical protein BA066_01960 [Candidatus Korarchaeota archaeon NZ13-K]|nr:MAG: hypothetical protein BA066_01960 [Candidatus Korarchaeota archaeon NZ13-K]